MQLKIKVLTAKSSVTIGGLHLEHTTSNLQDGDIKSAATEIVDSDDLAIVLLHAEGKGSSSGLVDDTLDVEVGDLASILSGLPLRIVKVSGDRDNGLLDGRAKVRLSSLLHLDEDEGADLRGRVALATGLKPSVTIVGLDNLVGKMLHVFLGDIVVEATTNQTLSGEQSVLRVLYGLNRSK